MLSSHQWFSSSGNKYFNPALVCLQETRTLTGWRPSRFRCLFLVEIINFGRDVLLWTLYSNLRWAFLFFKPGLGRQSKAEKHLLQQNSYFNGYKWHFEILLFNLIWISMKYNPLIFAVVSKKTLCGIVVGVLAVIVIGALIGWVFKNCFIFNTNLSNTAFLKLS